MKRAKKNLDKLQLSDYTNDYRIRALFSMIPSDTRWKLLDLGSGNGEIANIMQEKFAHITLSDYSDPLLTSLHKRFEKRNDVSVRNIDVRNFPADETYDMITACDLIEHLEDDVQCLKRCFHSLKQGGVIFVSVPAVPVLYGRRDKNIGHYRRYTKRGLAKKLTVAGFTIQSMQYWNITGVMPYIISEKILQKALVGPARQVRNKKDKAINAALYALLVAETKMQFLPIGLSLIAIGKK